MYLKINQNNTPETVNAGIIHRLCELAKNGSLDAGSSLTGAITSPVAYEGEPAYLMGRFPGLSVSATKEYLMFEDDWVGEECIRLWGDGTGVTKDNLLTVTDISKLCQGASNAYANRKLATKFNEFKYFVGFRESNIYGNSLQDWSNLEEVSFPPNLTNISGICKQCSKLVYADLSNCLSLTTLGADAFTSCPALRGVAIPQNVTTINGFCQYSANVKWCKCFAVTPPTITVNKLMLSSTPLVFVPDSSVSAYQAANKWSSLTIYGMSDFETYFPGE